MALRAISLPLFHQISGQKVVLIGSGASYDNRARLITKAGGILCGEEEAHQAKIGFVAFPEVDDEGAGPGAGAGENKDQSEDQYEDEDGKLAPQKEPPQAAERVKQPRAGQEEAAALRLKRKGLLINVADRPDLCDFTMPSILEREPVLIAFGSGGASAGLIKHLRLRMERLLPKTLGQLAQRLNESKPAIAQKFPKSSDRRHALDQALSEGGMLDPFDPASAEKIENWLNNDSPDLEKEIAEITLNGNDPESLTLGQLRLLARADWIYHESNISEEILRFSRADAHRHEIARGQKPVQNPDRKSSTSANASASPSSKTSANAAANEAANAAANASDSPKTLTVILRTGG